MAKELVSKKKPIVAEEDVLARMQAADLEYREKQTPVPAASEDEDYTAASLTHEQRKLRRLAKRPNIDHLPPGVRRVLGPKDPETGLCSEIVVPMFDVGEKIVVERVLSWSLDEWLDTRVYQVRSIDDETGVVKCLDLEANHHATVGFKHPGQTFKLCPQKGDPFAAPKVKNAGAGSAVVNGQAPGEKKRRGRPKGSKNRSKEEINAEKAQKREKKGRR